MKFKIPGQGRVLAHYGEDIQSVIHMEECAELIQAVSKMRRLRAMGADEEQAYNNLVEEIADVLICIEQIIELYKIPGHTIQYEIDRKCVRQEERMYGHA